MAVICFNPLEDRANLPGLAFQDLDENAIGPQQHASDAVTQIVVPRDRKDFLDLV
jgi:hypothetical protein